MRTAAQVFYLAVFALLGTSHASSESRPATKSKNASPDVCAVSKRSFIDFPRIHSQHTKSVPQFEPGAIVSDACASYSTLDQLNTELHPYIRDITQNTDFFSYYRLNLYNKKCPFWSDENGLCGNIACAVNTLENEEDIPLVWRAKELGKLEGPKAHHPGKQLQAERQAQRPLLGELGAGVGESCVVEYDDECDERDYCIPEDESASAKGDYVSLVDNPERFTGYSGPGAHQVWEAIYRENCFSKPQSKPSSGQSRTSGGVSSSSPFGFGNPQQAQAAQNLRNVIKDYGVSHNIQEAIAKGSTSNHLDDGLELEDSCIEKRVFYRVISGMHASISTHLCHEYLNQTTGEWGPNLNCYIHRLHNHPERISNLYFNYALLLRATAKLRPHIQDYQFCAADPSQNILTKRLTLSLADAIPSAGREVFDESVMFRDPDAAGLKDDFRNRFRNVSRIMDCVGCDKCRLWGKVQTAGYGTALKVLFEFDEKNAENDPPLRRTELVALVNTLDKVSSALNAIRGFERMIEERKRGGEAKTGVGVVRKPGLRAGEEILEGKIRIQSTAENDTPDADEDDGHPDFSRTPKEGLTISEVFWDEFDLVFRTYVYVLRSWMNMPAKLWRILILETSRLWDFWLGLPVKPRSWEIRKPGREEL